MKLHRFITSIDLSKDQFIVTDPELVHQLQKVLRARVNYEFILNNNTEEITVRTEKLLPHGLQVTVIDRASITLPEGPQVTLYCAILKRDNFELVVQKATEIGVYKIVPLLTRRTIKQNIRPDRLQAIIKEAVEQSGRSIVPALGPITSFEDVIQTKDQYDSMILCDSSGQPFEKINGEGIKNIALLIGPEGGFEHAELETARTANLSIITLGEFTLRAETAAIVASYLLTH